jgi:hypothetical protein
MAGRAGCVTCRVAGRLIGRRTGRQGRAAGRQAGRQAGGQAGRPPMLLPLTLMCPVLVCGGPAQCSPMPERSREGWMPGSATKISSELLPSECCLGATGAWLFEDARPREGGICYYGNASGAKLVTSSESWYQSSAHEPEPVLAAVFAAILFLYACCRRKAQAAIEPRTVMRESILGGTELMPDTQLAKKDVGPRREAASAPLPCVRAAPAAGWAACPAAATPPLPSPSLAAR